MLDSYLMSKLRKFFNNNKLPIGILATVAFVMLTISFGFYRYSTATSAISVESVPDSIVFINGEQRGRTPLELELRGGEADLRLLPESLSDSVSDFQTTVKLTHGVRTIVRHVFSNLDTYSQTEVISFEQTGSSSSSLAVVTVPDGVKVKIDNKDRGVSPLRVGDLLTGRHRVEVVAEGYRSRSFDVQTVEGYLLTAFVDLAEDEKYVETDSTQQVLSEQIEQEAKEIEEVDVTILETPTGFLRVRDQPGISGLEVGRVIPGEKHRVLTFNAEEGWYKIDFESTASGELVEEGWISAKFASASARLKE